MDDKVLRILLMSLVSFLEKYPKKHIVFDLDNTLAILHIDWNGFRDALWEHVCKFDSQIIKEQDNAKGRAIHLYNAVILKHGKEGKELVDTFCEVWEKEKYSGYSANEELVKFMKTNANFYTYHVWTSNNRETIIPVLEDLGIKSLISNIVTKESSRLGKPFPDGFNEIFDNSFNKSDYLMVGNSNHDRDAAKAAGIDFLRVKRLV